MSKEEKRTPSDADDLPIDNLPIVKILRRSSRILRYMAYTCGVFLFALTVTYLVLKSRPLPAPDNYSISQVYDAKDKYIGQTIIGQPHEVIRLKDVPSSLVEATLAAEDKNFYHHYGFSVKGIARAFLANAEAGGIVQGASTITQQLARNLYLTHDRTWVRKLKEALLTLQLEIHYSKDQILEMYLNNIYYGHGCYGVGRAAKVYFHKRIQDLTLAESAFLAGIPRGPQYYSPYFHRDRAKNRQQDILTLMTKNNAIAPTFNKEAQGEPIHIEPRLKPKQVNHSYFRDYIIKVAVNKYGLNEEMVRHGGLKIYTTLDPVAQQKAEEVVKNHLKNKSGLQGALLSVDPNTGHIKAMVGGKDYSQSQYNRVLSERQPGSAFKPILYLSALEHGFTPLTKIVSKPTTFSYNGLQYKPRNFGDFYSNKPITLRQAIARSDNIYAVTAQYQTGLGPEIEMARKLGITSALKARPSLALGSFPVSVLEMTQAYQSIASLGVKRPLIGIRKIVDPYGRVLVEEKNTEKKVIPSKYAFVLTKLMESVFEQGGTAHRVRQMIPNMPLAGKTGSTDWDSWLCGYSPDLVTTVWIGYDRNKRLSNQNSRIAQYIWGKYMKEVATNKANSTFQIPNGVKAVHVDVETGYIATSNCPHQRKEYFISGTEPEKTCPDHPETAKSIIKKFFHWFKSSDSKRE